MKNQVPITTTHPDDTCAPDRPCDRCVDAERQVRQMTDAEAWAEFEQAEDAGRFETVWDSAPRERQRLVMREDAEYWFLRGRQWGMAEALEQANADLRQLLKENTNDAH